MEYLEKKKTKSSFRYRNKCHVVENLLLSMQFFQQQNKIILVNCSVSITSGRVFPIDIDSIEIVNSTESNNILSEFQPCGVTGSDLEIEQHNVNDFNFLLFAVMAFTAENVADPSFQPPIAAIVFNFGFCCFSEMNFSMFPRP